MKLQLNKNQFFDTNQPLDLSIPIHNGKNPVLAWYCDPIKLEPVMTDRFIGDVNKGGAVNFRNLFMNPHAHGTHTECVGHISAEFYSINQCLKVFHFEGVLISVVPEEVVNSDYNSTDCIVSKEILEKACKKFSDQISKSACLVVRTMPNESSKLSTNYSNTNPIYFNKEAIEYINCLGIDHLMVDLPSIDREEDGGGLIGHHVFWDYPKNPQVHKTITELIFVPSQIKDGHYIVNIQITSLENDASPSKIVLYKIQNI